jgi:membrane protein DedA with SNARE-associated domain
MLAGGAFAATGDLSLTVVASAALVGAVAGDQAGWLVGRSGSGLLRRVAASPARRQMLARARSRLERNDLVTVYLTRWLFSPLGPWVNLAAGATGLRWHRFTLGSIAGELTWVALYVGLGWAFAAQVDRLGSLMGNLTGFAAAAGVAALLARALWRRHH